MSIKRPDTPLAPTPEPLYVRVKNTLNSREKQSDGKYSALHKGISSSTNPDGSSMTSFNKQTEKENGKIKLKSYDVSKDESGNPKMLQITRKTNTGNERTRVITNPKKIERKMKRVLNRNEM
jgi:hypothetical protein